MSLNDDAIKDLLDQPSEVSDIQDALPAEDVTVLVSPDSSAVSDKALEALGGLEENQDALKVATEGIKRLCEMEDTLSDVLSSETIDRGQAVTLCAAFEDFATEVANPAEFSQVPTRTNVDQTKSYLRKKIEDERGAVVNSFSQYVNSCRLSIETMAAEIEGRLYPDVMERLERLHLQALSDLPVAAKSKNLLVYTKEPKLVDIRLVSIPNYPLYEEVSREGAHLLPSKNLCSAMRSQFGKDIIRGLIKHSTIQHSDSIRLLSCICQNDQSYQSMSYLELLSYYAENNAGRAFESIHSAYAKSGSDVAALLASGLDNSEAFTYEGVSDVIEMLSDYVTYLTFFYRLIIESTTFFTFSEQLMDHYRSHF